MPSECKTRLRSFLPRPLECATRDAFPPTMDDPDTTIEVIARVRPAGGAPSVVTLEADGASLSIAKTRFAFSAVAGPES